MALIPILGPDAPPLPLPAEQDLLRHWMRLHPLAHHPLHAVLSPAELRRLAFALWCYQQSGMPL